MSQQGSPKSNARCPKSPQSRRTDILNTTPRLRWIHVFAVTALGVVTLVAFTIEAISPLGRLRKAQSGGPTIMFSAQHLERDSSRLSALAENRRDDSDIPHGEWRTRFNALLHSQQVELSELRKDLSASQLTVSKLDMGLTSVTTNLKAAMAAVHKSKTNRLQVPNRVSVLDPTVTANRDVRTDEWIVPRHVEEYLGDHTPDEYVAKLSRCGDTVTYINGKLSNHTNGWVINQHLDFLKAFASNFTNVTNVTVGFNTYDYDTEVQWPCFVYSTLRPYAASAFLTFDEILGALKWVDPVVGGRYPRRDLMPLKEPLPWSKRSKTPLWRGTLWWGYCGDNAKNVNGTLNDQLGCLERQSQTSRGGFGSHGRLVACMFSIKHPKKLDAKIGGIPYHKNFKVWQHNKTNGVRALLPPNPIEPSKYFGTYQTHLVLGGIGAAFRLTQTLESGTAVVLEEFPVEIWYTRFLQPYVHYIPLAYGAKNLSETLDWIEHHPADVKQIATNGRRFYDVNLSPQRRAQAMEFILNRIGRFLSSWNYDPKTHNVTHP